MDNNDYKRKGSLQMIKKLTTLVLAVLLTACAATVEMGRNTASYTYKGEKFGNIVIELSDAVTADSRKIIRMDQIDLDNKIKNYLMAEKLYDENSSNTITVVVNHVRIRRAFFAIMFGAMSGSDSLEGTVRLNTGKGYNTTFDITATYSLGGIGGGQNGTRLGWLGDTFAELTVNTIIGKS